MKRDIHKPLKNKEEILSKGTVLGYLLLIFSITFITGLSLTFLLLITQDIVIVMISFITIILFSAIYFIFVKHEKLLINTVYIYYRYMLKRIYREGKPSRLSDDERFGIAWENTINKFEEPCIFPDWVLRALKNLA